MTPCGGHDAPLSILVLVITCNLFSTKPLPETMLTYCQLDFNDLMINPSHKSHNASVKYPTMYQFVTEMCTHSHSCYKMLHCGIWVWCIVGFVRLVYEIIWHYWSWLLVLLMACCLSMLSSTKSSTEQMHQLIYHKENTIVDERNTRVKFEMTHKHIIFIHKFHKKN